MAEISQQLLNAQKELMKRRALDGVSYRPPTPKAQETAVPAILPSDPQTPNHTKIAPDAADLPGRVKVYPTLAAAFLRRFSAVGRVYFLLKAYDLAKTDGGGGVNLTDVRELLTGRGEWSHITWRRLRQILDQGEGVTWHRDTGGRLWLHSPAAVANCLDIGRLCGRPVWVATGDLVKGAKETNAHLYGAYLSGCYGGDPITRRTIYNVTAVSPSSQRDYEELLGITPKINLSLTDETFTHEAAQRAAWRHGRAVFRFTDHHGKQPHLKAGDSVIAWQLPNSYSPAHEHAPRGRQKKLNRRIDLVNKEARGHDPKIKIYFPAEELAAKAANRAADVDHYYQTPSVITPKAARLPKLAAANVWTVIQAFNRK